MADVKENAHKLAELHLSGETLVMPTVWDVWSAKIAVEAGAKALTVGSHPVAEVLGAPDGEKQSFDHYLAIANRIIESVDVPVSVDVESGYGLSAEELVKKVLKAGAAGVNIEDTVHTEDNRLRSAEEHAQYIADARKAADEAGVELVINGRTDVLTRRDDFEDAVAEAVKRVKLMVEAGARSVYPVSLKTPEEVKALVEAVDVPVNATFSPVKGHPAAEDLEGLKALGVRRLTTGPLWQAAIVEPAKAQLKAWF